MSVSIISETRRQPAEASPPANAIPHLWSSEADRQALQTEMRNGRVLAAYVNKHAEAKMRNHALSMRDRNIEVMGLLLGEVRHWQGKDYLLVRDVVTSDLDATSVSVRFENDGFQKLFEKLDGAGFDYVIVGWYHSHPGYGCFMSATDVKTHIGTFVSPHNIALVIDPKNFEIAGFGQQNGTSCPRSFAVYWDEYDDPYGGLRRLRK